MNRNHTNHPCEFVVIVGCGRLGSLLAGEISRAGSKVVIIDRREDAFILLPPEFSGFHVGGDAVEQELLRAIGLKQADCLIAVTEKDTTNLMVAQVAKHIFAVPRVLARVYDPRRTRIYRQDGIEIISPTRLMADAFLATAGFC